MNAQQPRMVLAELLASQVVVCDGAMGTMLHTAGVPLDRSLPELNLSRPALVRDLHAAYLSAGARILQTNTFGANRWPVQWDDCPPEGWSWCLSYPRNPLTR